MQITLGGEISLEMGGSDLQQGKKQEIVVARVEMKWIEGKKVERWKPSK